jgi:hypothetical protein
MEQNQLEIINPIEHTLFQRQESFLNVVLKSKNFHVILIKKKSLVVIQHH